ncbi:MAG: hypothetical protein J6X03_04965 [Bacilli bacterium]|nr:hypothetical protein [Bacilli bacterium]
MGKLMNNKKGSIIAVAVFGAIALSSASTTLAFMSQNSTSSPIENNFTNEEDVINDEIKNALFENITAADLTIEGLKIDVENILNDTSSLTATFTGGANYLSFMKNETGNIGINEVLNDVKAKFGGALNVTLKDTSLGEDQVMLNENLAVYAPGEGKIYLDWNETGYTASGKFITNAIDAAVSFLNDEQRTALNDLLNELQKIDILTLLPMVGTIGGSLASEKVEVIRNGQTENQYTIEIPSSLLGEEFTTNLVVKLNCNENGELTCLALDEFRIPQAGKEDIILNVSTTNIIMHGFNSLGTSNVEGYKAGIHAEIDDNSLSSYYTNDLDTTPNLIYTVGKMMNAKKFKFDYQLNFDEYQYNENAQDFSSKIGEINPSASHELEGSLAADVTNGFDKGNYKLTLDKNESFGNDIAIQYQGNDDENDDTDVQGTFIEVNNSLKGYIANSTITSLTEVLTSLTNDQNVELSFFNANEILNDTVIGDIINGNWYKYKNILHKILVTNDDLNRTTISIQVKAKGLNLNIPFEFENTLIELNISYRNTDLKENTYIEKVEIKNIPLRKVNRLENQETVSYLDTASFTLNLGEANFNANESLNTGINVVDTSTLDNYADFKATIPLFTNIAEIVKSKQFASKYSLTYTMENKDPINVTGTIDADLNDASFDLSLDDKNLVEYRLTAFSVINDIQHHVQVDYVPNELDATNDQTLFFKYYSQNENYQTKLSLNTETLMGTLDAVTTLINANGEKQNDVSNLSQDLFGNISETIDKLTDFVDGDIWSLLKGELPTDKVNISNVAGHRERLKIELDTTLFGSTNANGNISVILNTNANNNEFAALDVSLTVPGTSDTLNFSLAFDEFDSTSVGVSALDQAKYKATDSSIEAVINILTGNYLDSFGFTGLLSKDPISPSF